MWDKILELAAQYGPFPVGVVFGVMIKNWSVSKFLDLSEREKESLRKEKRELIELVKAKEDRIDALHNKLLPNEKES